MDTNASEEKEFPPELGDILLSVLYLPPVLCELICDFFRCQNIRCRNVSTNNKKYCKDCRLAHRQENKNRWHRSYCQEELCFNVTKFGSVETFCRKHRQEKRMLMRISICLCKSSYCHMDGVRYVPRLGSVNWPPATGCNYNCCEGQAYCDDLKSDSDSGSRKHDLCKRCGYTCVS